MTTRREGATRILASYSAFPNVVGDVIVLASTPAQKLAIPGRQGDLYDPVPPFRDVGASKSGYEFNIDVRRLDIHVSGEPVIVEDGTNLVLLRQLESELIIGEVFTGVQMMHFDRRPRGEETSTYEVFKYTTSYRIEI